MSQQTVLLSIAAALRDEVAPQLPPGYSRLVLLACRHMLLRMAHPSPDSTEMPPLPLDDLPASLRDALAEVEARPLADMETPSENGALSQDSAAAIDRIVDWLSASSLRDDAQAIAALADWEGQGQDVVERLHETLDMPPARQPDTSLQLDPNAVEAYFRKRFGNDVSLTSFNQLLGGRSKQTALLALTGLPAEIPGELVLRRDQTAKTMTGSIIQEYPILEAVYEGGVAVAKPILLETDLNSLGRPFAILERVRGRSLGTHFDVPHAHGEAIAFGLAEQMARLHAIPASRLSGVFADAPLVDSIERRREQLAQMQEQWEGIVKTPSVTMTAAFKWLAANLDCAEGELSIVHGDLGFHNLMFEDDKFIAILDWETAHIDHPAGDLGYVRPAIEKMLPWQKFFGHYLAAGGRRVTSRQVHFFGMWEILRINIALRHCRVLYESGATKDPMLGEVGAYYVPRFVNRISQHLRRALHDAD